MSLSRRKFIQLGSLASASVMVPEFLRGFEMPRPAISGNKILVVIQLSGGNDGLNTIIPYRNDWYYKNRPAIGIARNDALALTDDLGINASLKNIKELYDNGNVSIINGVGYPEPNRSHFRSMDIWQTASDSQTILNSGWIGRYLDNLPGETNRHNILAMEVDDTLSLAMKGDEKSAVAIRDINQFHRAASNDYVKKLSAHAGEHEERLTGYLYQTLRQATSSADYIYAQSKIFNSTQVYPDTPLGKKMKMIGSLINSRSETQVYYVAHGSFDTHVGQKDRQERLFKQLDEAVAALVADLKAKGTFNDVLLMTFSEFGRRVAQNGSNGTDHGTAGNMLFISGGLKKAGVYNNIPSLEDLDDGDLKYTTDFRQVYATVLNRWLATDPENILGKRFDPLGFI